MKCRYVYDPKYGKVWIPGCIGGLHNEANCTCRNNQVKEKNPVIELENEISRLNRVIKKLIKKSSLK